MSDETKPRAANQVGAAVQELEEICNVLRLRNVQHAIRFDALTAESEGLKKSLASALEQVEALKNAATPPFAPPPNA